MLQMSGSPPPLPSAGSSPLKNVSICWRARQRCDMAALGITMWARQPLGRLELTMDDSARN